MIQSVEVAKIHEITKWDFHFNDYIIPIFMIMILFCIIIIMFLMVLMGYMLNKDKYLIRRLRKLKEKYPIRPQSGKEMKRLTKIKLGHYQALNNSKQFYETVAKEIEKEV